MDFDSDDLDAIAKGEYEIEILPNHVGELATHDLLLNMDFDELCEHLSDPKFFAKVTSAQNAVLTEIKGGKKWGSIYD